MAKWNKTPPTNGVYYLSKSVEDWDITEIVYVRKIETFKDVTLEVSVNNMWWDVSAPKFDYNIWFGPLEKITKPTEEDKESLR